MAGGKRDRFSSVDRLPEDIRQEIMRLRFVESRTFDEILTRLRTAAEDREDVTVPSRGALGRHIKAMAYEIDQKVDANLRAISPALQVMNQVTAAVTTSLSAVDGDDMLGGVVQLLLSMAFQMSLNSVKAANASDEELEADPALATDRMGPLDLTRVSRVINGSIQAKRHLQAMKIEAEKEKDRKSDRATKNRQAKALKQAEADNKAAADEVVKVARERGVSAESAAEFYKYVVGEA